MLVKDILAEDLRDGDHSWLSRHAQADFTTELNKAKADPDYKYVGSGTSAHVWKRDTPHDMDYVIRLSRSTHGHNFFLDYLHNNPAYADNPFFPRILSVDQQSNGFVSYKLEKLHPFTTKQIISNELLLQSLWEQYFTTPLRASGVFIADGIVNQISNSCYNPSFDHNLRDSHLTRAVRLIRMLVSKHSQKIFADIHENNLMWRITGNTPHLVITDPIASLESGHEHSTLD